MNRIIYFLVLLKVLVKIPEGQLCAQSSSPQGRSSKRSASEAPPCPQNTIPSPAEHHPQVEPCTHRLLPHQVQYFAQTISDPPARPSRQHIPASGRFAGLWPSQNPLGKTLCMDQKGLRIKRHYTSDTTPIFSYLLHMILQVIYTLSYIYGCFP